MKRITSVIVCMLFFGLSVMAQDIQLTGKITATEDGSLLPGVSVVVKGTTIGTTSSADGMYSLTVPEDATIVFSFIGMKTKEVVLSGQTTLDIELEMEVTGLEEVVVTALGQTRAQKSLGYSATTVKSEDFETQSQTDAMNALQGKIAGVQISSGGGAPGASTRVIIRGYSSVKGNNNPLYVIDGTPIDNSQRVDGYDTGLDFGNRANDINPNDIESMTVLKGAAATALYGPRAANGVIMVTTKRGKKQEKITVELSSSATVSDVLRLPQMQSVFGQGWSGHWADDENGSWGPKMDGELRLWGNVVDNTQKVKAFSNVEDNLYDFYDYGTSFSNAISMRGGAEKSNFYLSFANVTANGVIPTDVDKNVKNTITFNGSTSGKLITANTSFHYVRRTGSMIPDGWGGSNNAANLYSELLQIPRDFSVVDFIDYENDPFNTLDYFYTPYAFNPYYSLNENQSKFNENRIYGNVSLDAAIKEWISLTYRVGVDASGFNRKDWEAIMRFTPGSVQDQKRVTENPGMVLEENRTTLEFNQDFLIELNKEFGDISADGILGFSNYQRDYHRVTGQINSLVIPEFYNLSNTDVSKDAETYESIKRTYAYFGTANIGYKEFLFLNLSARQDYSSTLPKGANSFFYPAANLSFILSDLISVNSVDQIKLRAGLGKAGNDADPYLIDPVMAAASVWVPFSALNFPLGGVGAFEKGNTIGNPELKPEVTTESELGLDFRVFQSRLTIDLAYYNRVSDGQILPVVIPASSGFSHQIINFGKVKNYGIELLAGITPVRTNDFSWNVTTAFTKNNNEVVELPGDAGEIVLSSAYDVEFVAIEGRPLGVLRAPDFERDDEDHIIVSASTGIPEGTVEKTELGDIQPKYNLGVINTLKYKDFSFSFSIDYRPGGYFYSGTADLHYFVGNATNTMFNERQPFIIPNSVKENPYYDETDPTSLEYVENDVPITMTNVNAYYYHSSNTVANRDRVISRDYLKLREVTFVYSLPKELLSGTFIGGADIIISGRNLLIWTPEDNNFVDPESTSFGNDLRSEFGEFRTGPTTRSFTASLRVQF